MAETNKEVDVTGRFHQLEKVGKKCIWKDTTKEENRQTDRDRERSTKRKEGVTVSRFSRPRLSPLILLLPTSQISFVIPLFSSLSLFTIFFSFLWLTLGEIKLLACKNKSLEYFISLSARQGTATLKLRSGWTFFHS